MDELSAEEVRVLGCLIEKEATTPEQYPLTLNSLTLACNQATNREPVVSYDQDVVTGALNDLRAEAPHPGPAPRPRTGDQVPPGARRGLGPHRSGARRPGRHDAAGPPDAQRVEDPHRALRGRPRRSGGRGGGSRTAGGPSRTARRAASDASPASGRIATPSSSAGRPISSGSAPRRPDRSRAGRTGWTSWRRRFVGSAASWTTSACSCRICSGPELPPGPPCSLVPR